MTIRSEIYAASVNDGIYNLLMEYERRCGELRRVAQGPGVRSEAFAEALARVFELLPPDPGELRIHVSDGLVMEGKVGGG